MSESAHIKRLARELHARLEECEDPECQTKISKVIPTKTEIFGVPVQAILALVKKLCGYHSLLEVGVFSPLLDRAFARRRREEVPFAILRAATRRRYLANLGSHMIEKVLGSALGAVLKSNPDAVIHFLAEGMGKANRRVLNDGWEKLGASVRNTSLAGGA